MSCRRTKFPLTLMCAVTALLKRSFTLGGGNIDSARDVSCVDLALFR